MVFAALAGLVAALVVQASFWAYRFVPGDPLIRAALYGAVLFLGFLLTAYLPNWVGPSGGGKRPYDGLGDLFFQVHEPLLPDSFMRWGLRGGLSFVLAICTVVTGSEGASVELLESLAIRTRPRSSRWFDLRRRSDVSIALSASISAFFQSPLAGLVIALELAVGGRSMLAVISSVVAAAASQALGAWLGGFQLQTSEGRLLIAWDWNSLSGSFWGLMVAVSVISSLAAILFIHWSDWSERMVERLSKDREIYRGVIGALGIGGLLLALPELTLPSQYWLARLLHAPLAGLDFHGLRLASSWSDLAPWAAILLGVGVWVGASFLLATWGGAGVFSPLFVSGALFGHGVAYLISENAISPELLQARSLQGALLGGAVLGGTVLGTPVAAAVLVAELSGQYQFFFPALAATWLGMELRTRARTFSLPELETARRGLIIQGGRSTAVLESILVREAMTTEFECVRDNETVKSLVERVDSLRHPFFPVVDSAGKYIGMTTLDEVLDAQVQTTGRTSETSGALGSLLEVKDLLYRSGWRSPTILASQTLSSVQGLFEETPCIPVLSEERRVLGLLFVHQVRLAYDREVGRKSLGLRNSG
jgi:H+/Cl- antiporter ClcA/CBS domain-containing protein